MPQFNTVLIDIRMANEIVQREHYLHRQVHPKARPFAYGVFVGYEPTEWVRTRNYLPPRRYYLAEPLAIFIFGFPHFTKCRGIFGYKGLPSKWQTLMLYRCWVSPALRKMQGPKYSLSQHLAPLFRRIEIDYLRQRGVYDPAEPWRIEQCLSYSDESEGHRGIIYRAMGFEKVGVTNGTIGPKPGDSGRHSGKKNPNGRKVLWRLWLPANRPTPVLNQAN